jgi:hypothetical protein
MAEFPKNLIKSRVAFCDAHLLGIPCAHGHVTGAMTLNTACKECARAVWNKKLEHTASDMQEVIDDMAGHSRQGLLA